MFEPYGETSKRAAAHLVVLLFSLLVLAFVVGFLLAFFLS